MAYLRPYRVAETTTTTGTGSITLAGAVTGYASFAAELANGDTATIVIEAIDAAGRPTGDYEICDTAFTSPSTLSRGTLRDSSTGSRINFAAGSKRVFAINPRDLVDLGSADLIGTLSVAKGGTGTATAFTAGSVVFAGASGVYSQNNGQFFWDNTNNRLGIGTTAPDRKLDVQGSGSITVRSRSTDTSGVTVGILAAEHASGSSLQVRAGVGFTNLISTGAADPLIFSANSAEAMRITSAGNVGIGTTSPAQRIHAATTAAVSGTTQSFLRLTGDATYGADFGGGIIQGVGPIATISTVNAGTATERMRIDSSGNVGIGSTPAVRFQITQDQAAYSYFDYYNNTNAGGIVWRQIVRNLANTGNTSVDFAKLISSGFALNNNDAGAANFTSFGVGGTERMRIDSSGRVGIGTSSPAAKLDVVSGAGTDNIIRSIAGNAAYMVLQGTSFFNFNAVQSYDSSSNLQWSVGGGGAANTLTFTTNGANERMRITSAGNVGIGTTAPSFKLQVNGFVGVTDGTSTVRLANSGGVGLVSTVTNHPLAFQTNDTERMRIASGGDVGIGTIAPNFKLDVNGTGYFNSSVQFFPQDGFRFTSASAVSAMRFGSAFTSESTAEWAYNRAGGFAALSIGSTGSALTEIMRAQSNGNVGIGTSSPATKLQVSAASGYNEIRVTSGANNLGLAIDGSVAYLAAFQSTPLTFQTNSVERMRILTGGNVGIGTTSPGFKLEAVTNTTANVGFRVQNQSTTQFAGSGILCSGPSAAGTQGGVAFYYYNTNVGGTTGAASIAQFSFDGVFQRQLASYDLNSQFWNFSTNGSERMRIDSSGNVGIGTSSPGAKLDVSSSTFNIVASRSTGGYAAFQRFAPTGQQAYDFYTINGVEAGRITVDGSNFMAFATGSAAAERMRITSAGKVGIGTSSPDATAILDVSSTTAGFLPPRMSTAERDAIGGGAPPEGLILYNNTTDKLQVYSQGAWVNLH